MNIVYLVVILNYLGSIKTSVMTLNNKNVRMITVFCLCYSYQLSIISIFREVHFHCLSESETTATDLIVYVLKVTISFSPISFSWKDGVCMHVNVRLN